jgi:hypothetical protein
VAYSCETVAARESSYPIRQAEFGEVLRKVSFTPGTFQAEAARRYKS